MRKFTLASLKSFIKKNEKTLYIKVNSSFNGMNDSVETVKSDLMQVNAEKIDFTRKRTFWINGLQLVGHSDDKFEISKNGKAVNIFNCCWDYTLFSI